MTLAASAHLHPWPEATASWAVRTLSTRCAAFRFEHHGGLSAPHSSNTQRFLVIGSGCRTITVDSCRFTRNSSDGSVVLVTVPNVARVGDVPAGPGIADPATAILFVNADFQVPNDQATQAIDDIVVDQQSEVLVVGGRSGFKAASGTTEFKPIRVQSTLGTSEKQGSRAVTILNQPFQIRLPVMPSSARDAVTAVSGSEMSVRRCGGARRSPGRRPG